MINESRWSAVKIFFPLSHDNIIKISIKIIKYILARPFQVSVSLITDSACAKPLNYFGLDVVGKWPINKRDKKNLSHDFQ